MLCAFERGAGKVLYHNTPARRSLIGCISYRQGNGVGDDFSLVLGLELLISHPRPLNLSTQTLDQTTGDTVMKVWSVLLP